MDVAALQEVQQEQQSLYYGSTTVVYLESQVFTVVASPHSKDQFLVCSGSLAGLEEVTDPILQSWRCDPSIMSKAQGFAKEKHRCVCCILFFVFDGLSLNLSALPYRVGQVFNLSEYQISF